MKIFGAGIDIGSTTVKLVVLDENEKILYGEYRRHHAETQKTLAELLKDANKRLGDCSLRLKITGSGSINLGKALNIGFVQEVSAVATALQRTAPQTDVAIELGGEDAKIIYFTGGLEERMNGVCAGGTGSFIDQMASLLQTDAEGLNIEAENYKQIYPIAARCGVFAKTDIQPLINEGATKADLAASIFQAVVNQTISGLACGKPIRGTVAFLGGPLHYLPELKKAFIRTLKLTPETTVDPENSHLFAAMGAALESGDSEPIHIEDLIKRLESGVEVSFEMPRLSPLFKDKAEYDAFCDRHSKAVVPKGELSTYEGDCFLGIDAGSTTTKVALIGDHGELLYSFYANNKGNPIQTAKTAIIELQKILPIGAKIVRSCSTGYGEGLLKTAFSLDEGEVETIAHTTAAAFFDSNVDCVLDIGGQDMKCIKMRSGAVDTIMLNEACSSGCGSFIENFANSLGFSAADFAKEALFAEKPVDLGTRCTVFMNSNVKQAQKEGASVADISAGLAYSVIKNALYKVIKLADAKDLGKHIVVQGGTFYNHAVLRAFEQIAGVEAICPDISGIMGAFGAALIAKERYCGQASTMLSLDEIDSLTYKTSTVRCGGCSNNCMLTINTFQNGKKHITGNRCEKGAGGGNNAKAPSMVEYKRKRLFDYTYPANAPRGVIGIPRVLNMYENYPYWATFFAKLGFEVVLSPLSDRKLYERGMESIPSESECYPAKLSHGHVQWLIDNGVTTIFHPCVFYEHQETKTAQNHYNCPIVVSYAENLKNNVEDIGNKGVRYIRPFIAFTDEKTAADRLVQLCQKEWGISESEVRAAANAAWSEQRRAKEDIRSEGKRLLEQMEKNHGRGIVLAGRPYHIDPEINHGIPEMIASYGLTVFTEDSLPTDFEEGPLRVTDQWVYHSRLYTAAEFVSHRNDLELIQLNSFGCGLDAVTTDQVQEILENSGKLYTVLKIDEVNNLGAARIRIRSLLAAMQQRQKQGVVSDSVPFEYQRAEFTKPMFENGYTILAPQMSPIHFDILEPVFHKYGFNIEVLDNDNRNAIDTGLKYVNNDACFPSITVVGQIMDAVLSGKYDTNKLAVIMTQTGGCCRASNYVGFIRRALAKVGLSHIPVISLNANGMEKNEGFKPPLKMVISAAKAIVYGDLFMRCLYRVRPYEKVKGSADKLHKYWQKIAIDSLVNKKTKWSYKKVCQNIVESFDTLAINETVKKPRVGVVGEILVKYMPLANNHIVELLENEGAEAVVPDLMDFMNFCIYGGDYKHRFLGAKWISSFIAKAGVSVIRTLRGPALRALEKSKRFEAPMRIEKVAELAKPFLSLGNQYGEGWFLTGEMAELITSGVPNIVCIQPSACLPNHVVGKGVIKALKKAYPQSNIVAVDYDPGASEVNQLNRIKLMLSSARDAIKPAKPRELVTQR
ncbi:MAG: 2-hydroxyacyl-CoA dehydratase [Oscillospiraceae bacterium]|nr:2-hydroxyacyl-CoA dehydratase [Oscillospiraceae bacterium]